MQYVRRLLVRNAVERLGDVLQLGDVAAEERKILTAIAQNALHDRADEILGQGDYIIQLCIRNFRLDHPEFSQVPPGLALLGAESRPKAVHLAEGHAG